jgi:hypothetical protein
MLNSLISYSDAGQIGNSFYKIFSLISYSLAILGILIIDEPSLIAVCFLYNIFLGYIYSLQFIRNIPGMILLVFTMLIYVQIPVVFLCYKAVEHNFDAFISLPNDNEYYYQFLLPGLMFFFFAFFFIMVGLALGNRIKFRQENTTQIFRKAWSVVPWMLLGFITFFLIWKDNASIFSARADGTEKQESALALLFNDKTYQMVFPILFYFIPQKSIKKSTIYFTVIVLLFLILNIGGTSKAAILQVFTFFFLGPLAYFYRYGEEIFWPQKKLFFIGMILSVPFFLYSLVSRTFLGLGETVTIETIIDVIANSGEFDVGIVFELVFERLSAMINNFILLYSTYSTRFSLDYSLHFVDYGFSSLMNLVLPGTPFPDSYVLTSQLFPKVLQQQELESGLDRITLLQQTNTQPYSLFGVLIVIFSPIPILFICFILGFLFSLVFNLFKSDSIKIIIMYSFTGFFQSYGIEGIIQLNVITFITTIILVSGLKIFDRLEI